MARPKDQKARRSEITTAAMNVLAERGLQDVSLKEVAERAGLHPTSVLYYYPEFEELLLEALRKGMDRFYSRRREAIASISDARARLLATIRAGIPTDREDREVRMAWQAISFELRDQRLADYDRMYVERQIELYVSVLELGVAQEHFELVDDAWNVASNLLALEDYHGLRFLLGWIDSSEEAVELVNAYAALATRCDLGAQSPTQ